jgi:hypothetical protein
MGGVDVIDFTNPQRPREVAYYDRAPFGATGTLEIYTSDGVHNPTTGKGFEVYKAHVNASEKSLGRLNPQTQEKVLRLRD